MKNNNSQFTTYGNKNVNNNQFVPQQTPFGNYQNLAYPQKKYQIFDEQTNYNLLKKSNQKQLNQHQSFYNIQKGQQFNQQKLPIGLTNIANNCYMNSVLQMLFSILQFRKKIIDSNCVILRQQKKTTFQLYNLFTDLLIIKDNSLSPFEFYQFFLQENKEFIQGRQEDAHEFLLTLFLKLGQENIQNNDTNFFDEISQFFTELFIGKDLKIDQQIEYAWRKKRDQENNIITQLFVGLFCNELICKQCQLKKIVYEEFNVLTLSLEYDLSTYYYKKESCSLNDLIKYQFKIQSILNYKCSNCKNEDHQMKQKFGRLPQFLIIQFKRFNFNNQPTRIDTNIIFPINNLSLLEYCAIKLDQTVYDLKSIIHHNGTCERGHYYSTCKYKENDIETWYRFDDSIVDIVDINQRQYDMLGTPTPYMLVYEQKLIS